MARLQQFMRNIDNVFEIAATLVAVSVLWCICSLGIITAIPASNALYRTVEQVIRYQNAYPVKIFFSVLKKNIRQKLAVSLILSFAGLLILIVISCGDFMYATGQSSRFFSVFSRIVMAGYIMFLTHVTALLDFNLSLGRLAASGFLFSMKYFATSLILLCTLIIGAWIVVVMPICLLVVPGIVGGISVFFIGDHLGLSRNPSNNSSRNSLNAAEFHLRFK